MAKTKAKADRKLYDRLRSNGVRKSVARRASEALPSKGSAKPKQARKVASELGSAVDEIKDRVRGGSRKRSEAAKRAARTRKAKASKRSRAAKKGAKTRARR